MKLLLITPPMTLINTPYPATGYLTQYLREKDYNVEQRDLGLDLFHKLFCKEGLTIIHKGILKKDSHTEVEEYFLDAFEEYASTIDNVIRYLKGNDPSLALRISKRMLLPEGPRFLHLDNYETQISDLFGKMGIQDKAKHLASLYLDDIADIIEKSIDDQFGFSHYGESLASSQTSFSPLYEALKKSSIIDTIMLECLDKYITEISPDVIGFAMPFPGNVYGALKSAKHIKQNFPNIKIVVGGGFVNTELRSLADIRFFESIDYLIFDDGELPLKTLLDHLDGKTEESNLLRTWFLKNGKIQKSSSDNLDIKFSSLNGPTYDGLKSKQYIPMLEMPNPMHRMWSDFRWNKLLMAHGCYWKRCTFCDLNLDYIKRYAASDIDRLIESIERIVDETKQTGFHFVDEAAPPALIKKFSEKLIEKNIKISWWGNLRFDKQYEKLAELMADSGCVAVTGGLEVGSPRILKLIDKGVTIQQVAKVTKAFSKNGIYVHAYLMYGFPSQTEQETIDSLEIVKQLFKNDCIQSAYWHRFSCTAHSLVGLNPEKFGIKLVPKKIPKTGLFADNTVEFIDSVKTDNDFLGEGLRKALYNYMHGNGIDEDVRVWFSGNVVKTTIKKDYISKHCL